MIIFFGINMSIFSNFKTFRGGVHPPEFKELTRDQSFEIMPDPKRVILPLRQHIGKDAKPLVKKGVEVKPEKSLLNLTDSFHRP